MNRSKSSHIIAELKVHFPYTAFSVATGIIFVSIIGASVNLFHVFHPLHMFFSAVATTAMFYRHDKRVLRAALIGSIGAIGICGLSDILIPYAAGYLLGVHMQLHICIIQHPQIVVPFVLMGLVVGFLVPQKVQSTMFSHAAHVWISSMASILYLVSFGLTDWFSRIGMVFIYMILAVMIPCCMSDIIFPLMFVEEKGHSHR
ncbi:MAG: hypothetical protein ABIH01_05310 [Candidatus Omnitrophota bacterium]